jgi:ABC-type Zn uptake system ZnuABC Zn-binding protein ZnuA
MMGDKLTRRLILLLALILAACARGTPTPAGAVTPVAESGPLKVVATTTVIADFLRVVAQDKVEVTVIIKTGGNHHLFEPTASDVRAIAAADVIFANGVDLEIPWLNDIRESAGAAGALEELGFGTYRLDLYHRDHTHIGGDPYIWHNTGNAKIMIENLVLGLSLADPANADFYAANAAAFVAEIDQLTAEIEAMVAEIPPERRKVVTGHEAFYYFTDQFGIELIGTVTIISHETKPTSARDIEALISDIITFGVPAVFTGTTLDPGLAETVAAEAGVPLIEGLYGDSLGAPGSGAATYLEMMRYNAAIIVTGLK